nr:hypothetical protein Iba_chr14aCG5120 [Ipomoea batatas]
MCSAFFDWWAEDRYKAANKIMEFAASALRIYVHMVTGALYLPCTGCFHIFRDLQHRVSGNDLSSRISQPWQGSSNGVHTDPPMESIAFVQEASYRAPVTRSQIQVCSAEFAWTLAINSGRSGKTERVPFAIAVCSRSWSVEAKLVGFSSNRSRKKLPGFKQ